MDLGSFEFSTAARILFGPGRTAEIPEVVKPLGTRALVVTGRNGTRAEPLVAKLRTEAVACKTFPIDGEPTVEQIRSGAEAATASNCDVVIGFGGGSALDAAKAIAIVCTNGGDPLDFLEVVGRGLSFSRAPLPFVAIPTTAGTGAEVTRNAVLGSPEHGVKASLRSPAMLAKAVIVDPELTRDLPPSITAYTGFDALTQLLEAFVSIRSHPITDALCIAGLSCVGKALEPAVHESLEREAMAFSSLLGGMALTNAGLGAVHGFAAPLGGMLAAPHGAICAALLPHCTAVNIRALHERQRNSQALRKYSEAARLLFGPASDAATLPGELLRLSQRVGIQPLSRLGFDSSHIGLAVSKAAQASSVKANPLPLASVELREILEASLAA